MEVRGREFLKLRNNNLYSCLEMEDLKKQIRELAREKNAVISLEVPGANAQRERIHKIKK